MPGSDVEPVGVDGLLRLGQHVLIQDGDDLAVLDGDAHPLIRRRGRDHAAVLDDEIHLRHSVLLLAVCVARPSGAAALDYV